VNDSGSDGGSFSALFDRDTCEVRSSPAGTRQRQEENTHGPSLTCTNTDFELGLKEQIQKIQKSALSEVPGINKNFHISQDSCPLGILEIFFSTELFKRIRNEKNRYSMQQINKKKQEGPLKPKSVFAQWNPVTLQEKKKSF
jgi:hypothetical protein